MTEADFHPEPIAGSPARAPRPLFQQVWPPHPLLAAAAIVVLLVAALAVAIAVAGRGATSGSGLATVVVPAAPGSVGGSAAGGLASGGAAAAAPGAAGVIDAGRAAPAALAPAQTGVASGVALPSTGIIGPPCAAAPTVQFQGRGLAATGVAPIVAAGSPVSTLYVSIQERGSDPATVVGNAQAKVQAITAALQQAGVPPAAIQPSTFSSFGDVLGRQFTAYASVQAQVNTGDQLTQASRAVLQVAGVTGYSTSNGLAAQPTPDEVEAAVSAAATQARSMAEATARSVGVRLGDANSVATQPPSVCYGPGGPIRAVQVTVTYALR